MERQAAIAEIRRAYKCRDYLTKSKGRGMYCCPVCGSGTGENKTGAVKVYEDTNKWHCHKCGAHGDVIALLQLEMSDTPFNELIEAMASDIGITIDPYSPTGAPRTDGTRKREDIIPLQAKAPETAPQEPETAQADYTEYYRECRERIDDPEAAEYLRSRGISQDTAKAYWLGYDPEADPAKSNHPCKRIIIPVTAGHYIGRRIDGKKEYAKLNSKGSTPGIFNIKALFAQEVQEVFVTEGAIDALSIIEMGPAAIAINSTANAEKLLQILEKRRTKATLILCLDNDEAGQKAAEIIKAGLQRLNISYITRDICGDHKDPNEALTADREAFKTAIEDAQRAAAARPDNTSNYIDRLMKQEIERFKADIDTGFSNLDDQAGGLYPGLYVLAAISSLGKTSFALQLADQLAAGGNDVLYFSMEQSRLEMVSKSLARITAEKDIKQGLTSLTIRKGYHADKVQEAAGQYKATIGDRLSIIEGNFNCNISFIGEYIRHYMDKTNTRPIVFIDYLQILQPAPEIRRQTTKEVIDMAVTDIKRLSRELDITIFVISSINRGNYLNPIDFESLKESGGIEYTADVIWGLQLKCLTDDKYKRLGDPVERREKIKEAKAATPRELELVCLKNRYGISNYSCYFKYYPANDLFIEDGSPELETVPEAFKYIKQKRI